MIFRLADKSDDSQLRKLMRETIIPGHIKMLYTREPDFFESVRAAGGENQIIVADDNGQIVGVGCRTLRELYIDGESRLTGYLSSLRLSPSAQNSTALARGYSFLKKLHSDNKAGAYLTTIIHGNERAREILTSKRAGLPSYIPMGNYFTHLIPVKNKPVQSRNDQLEVLPASQISETELLEFLNSEGKRRQFFPVCGTQEKDIVNAVGKDNLFIAIKDRRIAGVMGLWNQEKFKQHIIAGYSPLFVVLSPLLNIALRLKGCYSLPGTGEQVRFGSAALTCIKDDAPSTFQELLCHVLNVSSSKKLHQLAIGFHESDPLCKLLKDHFHFTYRSSLYLVCWEDEEQYGSFDNNSIPYLELGTL